MKSIKKISLLLLILFQFSFFVHAASMNHGELAYYLVKTLETEKNLPDRYLDMSAPEQYAACLAILPEPVITVFGNSEALKAVSLGLLASILYPYCLPDGKETVINKQISALAEIGIISNGKPEDIPESNTVLSSLGNTVFTSSFRQNYVLKYKEKPRPKPVSHENPSKKGNIYIEPISGE